MSVHIHDLDCTLQHQPSGATLRTTPPRDNGGDGSAFSPTDLLAASLGSCALSTMALIAKRENLSWGDASVSVIKEMSDAPRRVQRISLTFVMPREVKPAERSRLEQIARQCPVARSLAAELVVPMIFQYPDPA